MCPASGSRLPLEARCELEVVELHRFFEAWFLGHLPPTAFDRFTSVMADSFVRISPEGQLEKLASLTERLQQAHASHNKPGPSLRIWIQNFRVRQQQKKRCLVTYQEWQDSCERVRGRLATALFHVRPDTPCGVEWLHLHETWMPET